MSENKLFVPIAIIAAGVLVAGAVILSSNGESGSSSKATLDDLGYSPDKINKMMDARGVSGKILGNPDAKVLITEYSDTECPFCKRYHETMVNVMSQYDTDTVAWQFKHFPLAQLHRKATKEAEALECMLELEGERAFWVGLDAIFTITPSNDGLNLGLLAPIAELSDINRDEFNECLDSGRHSEVVQSELKEAQEKGGTGTPFSVITPKDSSAIDDNARALVASLIERYPGQQGPLFTVNAEGTEITMSGAMPESALKQIIDELAN